MKVIKAIILFLTIQAALQNALAGANSTDSNGLYYVSSSATGETVKGSDGASLNLSEKSDIQIHHAHVCSLNNANTDFEVSLETSPHPVDPKTGATIKPMVLRIGERAYSSSGGGGTTGSYNSIFFNIHNPEEAKAAAKWLSVDRALRNAPGYKFFTQLIPARSEFTAKQPVIVKLKLKNLDDRTIAFQRGGQQRGARDNQYGFRAILNQQPVADTGNPINFGGLCGIVSLEPGKEFEDPVDLRKWFNFDRAGTYFIHGFYRLDFFLPGNKDEGLAPWNVIWEDYASADFQVVVK